MASQNFATVPAVLWDKIYIAPSPRCASYNVGVMQQGPTGKRPLTVCLCNAQLCIVFKNPKTYQDSHRGELRLAAGRTDEEQREVQHARRAAPGGCHGAAGGYHRNAQPRQLPLVVLHRRQVAQHLRKDWGEFTP